MSTDIRNWQRIFRTFMKNRISVAGTVIILIIIPIALFAQFISPHDPIEQDIVQRLNAPNENYLLGSDALGRDVLSRIIFGARVSLLVGVFSVAIGMVVGTLLGVVAGFYGEKIEYFIMRGVDVMMSFPDEVLGIMIMVVLGSGLFNLILVIGILLVPRFARLAHGPALTLRELEYVEASRAMGLNNFRIIFRHILPNMFGEVVVMGALWMGLAIRLEANLSFLGLGVSPPTPTWGNMIRTGIEHLTNAPWLSIFPGLAILITVLAFNLVGDGLRDVTDPKLRD